MFLCVHFLHNCCNPTKTLGLQPMICCMHKNPATKTLISTHNHPQMTEKASVLDCKALKKQEGSISQSSRAWPLLAHQYLQPYLLRGLKQEKRGETRTVQNQRKRVCEGRKRQGEGSETRDGNKSVSLHVSQFIWSAHD